MLKELSGSISQRARDLLWVNSSRITGATYEQIAEAGGGIRSSVEGVRKAGKKLLVDRILHALQEMAEQGTTTVEAKSGYGLTVESEIKSLETIRSAARQGAGHGRGHPAGRAMLFPENFKTSLDMRCILIGFIYLRLVDEIVL